MTDTVWDVVIVGGGMAGLVAAYELEQAGLQVLLLEGRERLGGRLLTYRSSFSEEQYAEAGAEYFEYGQRRVNHYIDKFQLKREATRAPYDRVLFGGHLFSFKEPKKEAIPDSIYSELTSHFFSLHLEQKYFRPLWKKWMSVYENNEEKVWECIESLSVMEVLRETGASLEECSYVRMMMVPDEGVELEQVSAVQLAQEAWPDDYMKSMFRLEGGNDTLVNAFAERIHGSVRVGCLVTAVEQSEESVCVHFSDGEKKEKVCGQFVILAIPAKPLRVISFVPELSKSKQNALQKISFAPVVKVLVQFRERYWKEHGWNGNFASEHPICIWNATEHQKGEPGILCFYMVASMAQQIRQMEQAQARHFLLGMLQQQKLLSNDAEVLSFSLFDWCSEPLGGGGWSVYPLGEEEAGIEELASPEGRVFFAGEHLPARLGEADEDLLDTVESALSSGVHAARNILKQLKIPSAKWEGLL